MARYFFDFDNGSSSLPDLVGRELPNVIAARAEAAKVAADLARTTRSKGDRLNTIGSKFVTNTIAPLPACQSAT